MSIFQYIVLHITPLFKVDVLTTYCIKLPTEARACVCEHYMGEPRKSSKNRGHYLAWGSGMFVMEYFDKLCTMSKISSRLPAVMALIIALPLDKVLELIAIFSAIEDLFNFILKGIIYLDGVWWGWLLSWIVMSDRKSVV